MIEENDVSHTTLFVVATPIGNLEDISVRAITTLAQVRGILAEDTRTTRRLLERHGISTSIESLHSHNESRATRRAMERLCAGEDLALVSDAGTPLLSDPGFELVAAARAANIRVSPIPGASAITAALSACALPAMGFWFEGFLPAKSQARRTRLRELRSIPGTLVFFEAPHRVCETLEDMCECFGEQREAAFARELTKIHEQIHTDTLAGLRNYFSNQMPRGEFVLLISNPKRDALDDDQVIAVLEPLLVHLPVKKAVQIVEQITDVRRNRIYDLALKLKK